VYRIAGTALAAVALGYEARAAFPYQGALYLVDDNGQIEEFAPRGRGEAPAATPVRLRALSPESAERAGTAGSPSSD
jgi:hypothetical protein